MQNLENLDVFEILITQKLLKCPKDPFVRSALIYIYNLGNRTFLYLICNRIKGVLECKTVKGNSQFERGQPMQQTRGLFCTCN